MPKVITIRKAQKAQGSCGNCRKPIEPGDSYRFWKFRYGGKHVRCMATACSPKASNLTQSEYLSGSASIEETFNEAVSQAACLQDIIDALNEASETTRELGEEQGSKLDNMPEGLQQGDTGQLLEARRDACETVADELESKASELEGSDEYEELDPELPEHRDIACEEKSVEREESESDEDWLTRQQEAVTDENASRLDAAREDASGVDFSWE